MARTRLYRNGVLESEDFPPEDISEYVVDPSAVVWLDMCEPTQADFELISEELGLHELAVEDALSERQRPKVDHYDDHDFLTSYSVRLDTETGELCASEIAVFVTKNALVTVRKDEHFDIQGVVRRWDAAPELAKEGVGYLLHGVLDYVVDGQFEVCQTLDDEIESLEDLVFDDRPDHSGMQRRALHLRKSLVQLRRVVLPMREVLSIVMRDRRIVDSEILHYYQDVYDHVLRASEWTESLRDVVTTIRETQLNIQSQRLNLIMKKVTSWAAIIAVPTAITGFYGQNVPYPGSQQTWGFWTSLALLILVSGGLYLMFRRRDWL
jgi:magnesium transporter